MCEDVLGVWCTCCGLGAYIARFVIVCSCLRCTCARADAPVQHPCCVSNLGYRHRVVPSISATVQCHVSQNLCKRRCKLLNAPHRHCHCARCHAREEGYKCVVPNAPHNKYRCAKGIACNTHWDIGLKRVRAVALSICARSFHQDSTARCHTGATALRLQRRQHRLIHCQQLWYKRHPLSSGAEDTRHKFLAAAIAAVQSVHKKEHADIAHVKWLVTDIKQTDIEAERAFAVKKPAASPRNTLHENSLARDNATLQHSVTKEHDTVPVCIQRAPPLLVFVQNGLDHSASSCGKPKRLLHSVLQGKKGIANGEHAIPINVCWIRAVRSPFPRFLLLLFLLIHSSSTATTVPCARVRAACNKPYTPSHHGARHILSSHSCDRLRGQLAIKQALHAALKYKRTSTARLKHKLHHCKATASATLRHKQAAEPQGPHSVVGGLQRALKACGGRYKPRNRRIVVQRKRK